MAKSGVTSVTDAYGNPSLLKAYRDANKADELSMRINCMIGYFAIDKMIEQGIKTGDGDEWVRVGGMKLTCDGSISERTALLSEPYVGRPDDFGILVMDEEELYDYAIKAHKADWQIGIHANGDVAIDKSLKVFERIQKEHPRQDPRFRLEHCTVVNEDLIQRIKKLNAIFLSSILDIIFLHSGTYNENVGRRKTKWNIGIAAYKTDYRLAGNSG